MLRDILLKSRSFAVLGISCIVVPVVVVFAVHSPSHNDAAALRQAAKAVGEAEHARLTATTAVENARATTRVIEREADGAVARATTARARARVVGEDDVVVSISQYVDSMTVSVPPQLIDRMRLDSTAVEALGTLVRWKDTVIVMQDRRIAADSLELLARANAFTALQRAKDPWCGRRCGIALGVGGMLAAAVAVGQVRRTFR